MPIIDLSIPGDPVPKARPRMGKYGAFTALETRNAEEVLRWHFLRAMAGRDPIACDVGIAVEFYRANKRRADGDNLLKLVTDSMNKLVVVDDSQIIEWFARVHRGVGVERARTDVFVYEIC